MNIWQVIAGRLNSLHDAVVTNATAILQRETPAGAQAKADTAQQAAQAASLPRSGGTLTGPLTLAGDPAGLLDAATRQYVLAVRDALVNGAPGLLDTLAEIAQQLATDETAAAAITTALNAHKFDTTNPHAVTKAQVGLGNVVNLAPADLPVSTAQQTAINTAIATAVANLVAGAPGALDTLLELANQLTADESAATALTSLVNGLRAATDTTFVTNLVTALGPAYKGNKGDPGPAGKDGGGSTTATDLGNGLVRLTFNDPVAASGESLTASLLSAYAAAIGAPTMVDNGDGSVTYLGFTVTDNGDGSVVYAGVDINDNADGSLAFPGTLALSGGSASVTDNGDGSLTYAGFTVTDNGDGSLTYAA